MDYCIPRDLYGTDEEYLNQGFFRRHPDQIEEARRTLSTSPLSDPRD